MIQELDENALLLLGHDPSAPDRQEQAERDKRHKAKNEMHINQKNVKVIRQEYERLQEEISKAQKMTQEELKKQRDLINGVLDKKLADIKN